ncbi:MULTISPECIES: NAD(P)/FAD-dependent oxidoreductase [unclassified Pseudoalteromonas]|uniref:NAD(P)/FAD-dependent oxidoreductase n=1 Tax=unclassified Pseudoalteromonas TaxID=194690 RepID=UPI000B3D325B|nr:MULTISPECIES: NAD(P)/FAD-dependent oxidoreductase [unclassified Pseudoalteromonas]MDN3377549.1 NAD(P)/FAD-dependent oxidoreductase [Pseudoalteromonas sp. APC 3893]MDN3385284.1 NAD(P)/FAD-dependent oxidoreductase [Pseudoalteromonas sp. APC 4017]OUS72229.1 FAD-dependent oxidoreductase [Pseudoalteromonas sp. A601]
MTSTDFDVSIIGAGPSGTVAACLLMQHGLSVCIIERDEFPRFSIGESLLPQSMDYLKQANMLEALIDNANELGFQFKNGAAFYRSGHHTYFNFEEKFSEGPGTTYQVKRAEFDNLLAEEAQKQGATICFSHQVTGFSTEHNITSLDVIDLKTQQEKTITARFTLDGSGFGRVLPRLLDLEEPSELTPRKAVFTHFKDNIDNSQFDRNKILITVHPTIPDIWYWAIPFSDSTISVGVVGETAQIERADQTLEQTLLDFIHADDNLSTLLADAQIIAPVRTIGGYSANVKALHGDKFALLGNAGEFLDPVFSSGVTIALKSAVQATELVVKQLAGENIDWQSQYEVPLREGIDVFKYFVNSWYDTSLQSVIFFADGQPDVKAMVCSILAGYAWDKSNPFVKNTKRGLKILEQICEPDNNDSVA